jgi:hypothetical protein
VLRLIEDEHSRGPWYDWPFANRSTTRYAAPVAAQEIAALAIVAGTAGIFAWKLLRRRRLGKKSSGCGCAGTSAPSSRERVIFSARKGERPQIIIKSK